MVMFETALFVPAVAYTLACLAFCGFSFKSSVWKDVMENSRNKQVLSYCIILFWLLYILKNSSIWLFVVAVSYCSLI